MGESLESALRGIDGKNLVTEDINNVLESMKEDSIPDCWMEAAYPTLDNLPDFVDDLVSRTEFLRSWQTEGRPRQYWLAALFEPGDFLIAILYIASLDGGKPFHELTLGTESLKSSNWIILHLTSICSSCHQSSSSCTAQQLLNDMFHIQNAALTTSIKTDPASSPAASFSSVPRGTPRTT